MNRSLPSIQGLRAIAASCVVVSHSLLDLSHINKYVNGEFVDYAMAIGESGVNVFFAISGFIMVYNSFNKKSNASDFFVKRILRILPLYLVATTLQFVNKYGQSDVYDLKHFLYSIFFIPYIGDGGQYRPVLSQGWTLNLEMFFYLLFALSLLSNQRLGLIVLVAVLSFFALGDKSWFQSAGFSSFYNNIILMYFVAGVIVGIIYKSITIQFSLSERSALTASMLILCLVVFTMLHTSEFTYVAAGLLACGASVYLCAIATKVKMPRLTGAINKMGDSSYSVYLFHGFLLGALKHLAITNEVGGKFSLAIYLAIVVVSANVMGLLIYSFVERRLTMASKAAYETTRAPLRQSAANPPLNADSSSQ